jgi:hypothetical protein
MFLVESIAGGGQQPGGVAMNRLAIVAAFLATGTSTAAMADLVSIASFDSVPTIVSGNTTTKYMDFAANGSGFGGSLVTNKSGSAVGPVPVKFEFLTDPLANLGELAAAFTLSATTTNPAGTLGGLFGNPGVSGSFSFLYAGPNTVIDSISLTTGENLLSGTFSKALIAGSVGRSSGSVLAATGAGSSITYTSALEDLSSFSGKDFSIALTAASPPFSVTSGHLGSFRATPSGNFSVTAVPEMGTWALMIVGFGGIGASMRGSRRRKDARREGVNLLPA